MPGILRDDFVELAFDPGSVGVNRPAQRHAYTVGDGLNDDRRRLEIHVCSVPRAPRSVREQAVPRISSAGTEQTELCSESQVEGKRSTGWTSPSAGRLRVTRLWAGTRARSCGLRSSRRTTPGRRPP